MPVALIASAMLKIVERTTGNREVTLQLEGRVVDRWVIEVRRLSDAALARPGCVLTIDMTGVSFIDAAGVELFADLQQRRVVLTNCSPFTAEQLNVPGDQAS